MSREKLGAAAIIGSLFSFALLLGGGGCFARDPLPGGSRGHRRQGFVLPIGYHFKNPTEIEVKTMEQMKKKGVVNGVNVDQLFSTIDLIKENPEIARFKFRATNQWVGGTHSRSMVRGFYGALKEDDSRKPAVFDMDEPPLLLGNNEGTNPVEYLLVALSGCLTTSLVAHASAKGILIKGVESRYEGDIDLRGFLGLSEDVPAGYQSIRVRFRIDADVSRDQKQEMIRMAQKYSPVFNTITQSTPVAVELD